MTWGDDRHGGDSSAVRDQLKNVQQIQATAFAFAAILGDCSVVTWGDADCGGDCSAVRDQLKNVQQIQATQRAFAAILGDGSVVTWGDADCGGDRSSVRDQLTNVQHLYVHEQAFAAVLADSAIETWGDAFFRVFCFLDLGLMAKDGYQWYVSRPLRSGLFAINPPFGIFEFRLYFSQVIHFCSCLCWASP